MKESNCPTDQLSLLICDELSSGDTIRVMDHLEKCAACQSELGSLTADDSWWSEAKLGLANADTDEHLQILEAETVNCSIDTLLDDGSNPVREISSQAAVDMLDSPSHPEMLGRIDEFDIEEKIGQGGMGIVFRGFDHSLNRPVAIKIMSPHLATNDIARQRFEREARAAAAVVHPNVIPIYRVSTTRQRQPYMAMALADGLSLQEYVESNGPFDVKDVVRVSAPIAAGLAEAHRQGLIHRDIKPANVLMEKDVSRIMITDFGLARAADDVMMTQSGCLAGTPHYMSPEQVSGTEIDHRSDLFSLGSLMYFIATGREPFQGETPFAVINKLSRDYPKSPRSINVDIPEVLNRIIERLLEKEPRNRIGSATELEETLTQVLAHLQEPSQHGMPDVKATTVERRRTRMRVGWGVAIAALVLFGCLALNGFFGSFTPNSHLNHSTGKHGDGSLQQHLKQQGHEAKGEQRLNENKND